MIDLPPLIPLERHDAPVCPLAAMVIVSWYRDHWVLWHDLLAHRNEVAQAVDRLHTRGHRHVTVYAVTHSGRLEP